jgi:superfamily II DNA or RNA helicase
MTVNLDIQGSETFISGDYPLKVLQELTSYEVKGAEHVQSFKRGFWNGRKNLFSKRKKLFPSGLVPIVVEEFEKLGLEVKIKDSRRSPGPLCIEPNDFKIKGVAFNYPYDFQLEAAKILCKKVRGVLNGATNCGKTIIACLMIKMLKVKTLFIVPNLELLYQTKKVFEDKLEVPIGIIGEGHWDVKDITVATMATLYSRVKEPECEKLLAETQLLIADECHHASSDSYYMVIKKCNAYYRYGFSGTPLKRSDGKDLMLLGATGPILYSIRNKELIERGISVQPYLKLLTIDKPVLPKSMNWRDTYEMGIINNHHRNKELVDFALNSVKEDNNVLILIREIKHGKNISALIPNTVCHRYIHGQDSTECRKQTLKDYREGKINILISSVILDEGIDLPNIDVLILAGGGKSAIKIPQRIGRGLRLGGKDKLIVVDTIDLTHHYLADHSYNRVQIYKEEDCFDIEIREAA